MGRLVKIFNTNEVGDSNELYKVGTKWFKNQEHYIEWLKLTNVSFQDIFDLLSSDRNCLLSDKAKIEIISLIKREIIENHNQE